MKPMRTLAAISALAAVSVLSLAQEKPVFMAPNLDTITLADIKKDVYFLASDEMGGRETLSEHAKVSAGYVRARMQAAGLKPAGENGTWYQEVGLRYNTWDGTPALSFKTASGETKLEYGKDFVSTGGPGESVELASTPLAFAGYAVKDDAHSYDDLSGLDLKGKIAVVLRYEPTPWRVGGRRNPFSRSAFLQTKQQLCQQAGAVGILLVTGPEGMGASDNRRDLQNPGAEDKSPPLELDEKAAGEAEPAFPFLHLSIGAADKLLGSEGALKKLQQEFDQGDFKNRPDMKGATASLSLKSTAVRRTDSNVAGKLEGETDEWIIFGAHHDHLGLGYFGSRDADKGMGQVHNGADDNASGVATVLEIAEAMAASGKKPRRSMLFMTFTGEEKGLLGSAWYVQHPLVPNNKVVAMINIDMLGRLKDNEIEMQGTASSKFLRKHCEAAAPLFPELKIKMSTRAPIPASDHWPFFSEAGIPVIFPMGAIPAEMHTALDDPETIQYEGILYGARYLAEIGWRISQDKDYADYTGPVKNSIGPNGLPRDPTAPKPKDPNEEKEEGFSGK